jgi:copper resistance protein C
MQDIPMTFPRRRPPRVLAALALLAALAAPLTANAHAILVDSRPAIGARIAAGPATLTLRYNSRIDRGRSRLTLNGPDKTQQVLPIADSGPEDVLATQAELAPGAYVLRWQVLAIDGHITRGDVPFTVLQAGDAAITAAGAPAKGSP